MGADGRTNKDCSPWNTTHPNRNSCAQNFHPSGPSCSDYERVRSVQSDQSLYRFSYFTTDKFKDDRELPADVDVNINKLANFVVIGIWSNLPCGQDHNQGSCVVPVWEAHGLLHARRHDPGHLRRKAKRKKGQIKKVKIKWEEFKIK